VYVEDWLRDDVKLNGTEILCMYLGATNTVFDKTQYSVFVPGR